MTLTYAIIAAQGVISQQGTEGWGFWVLSVITFPAGIVFFIMFASIDEIIYHTQVGLFFSERSQSMIVDVSGFLIYVLCGSLWYFFIGLAFRRSFFFCWNQNKVKPVNKKLPYKSVLNPANIMLLSSYCGYLILIPCLYLIFINKDRYTGHEISFLFKVFIGVVIINILSFCYYVIITLKDKINNIDKYFMLTFFLISFGIGFHEIQSWDWVKKNINDNQAYMKEWPAEKESNSHILLKEELSHKPAETNQKPSSNIFANMLQVSDIRVVPYFSKNGEPIGFKITNIEEGSYPYKKGLRSNDVLQSINNQLVKTWGDYTKAVQACDNKSKIDISVERNGSIVNISLSNNN
jgi:hypothetical protein